MNEMSESSWIYNQRERGCEARVTVTGRDKLLRRRTETVFCEKRHSHVGQTTGVAREHLGTLRTLRSHRVDLRWTTNEAGQAIISHPRFVEEAETR